jgi:hypothetical protein
LIKASKYENILTTDIKLPGYHEPFRNDRNCFGGGVLVYTADYLHVLRRNDLEFNGGELIWLTSENVVSSSCEKSIGSNKAPNIVGSRIQFVRLKIFIIWFKRWITCTY